MKALLARTVCIATLSKEPRPYGEGSVYETFRECDILDELADGDCPGLKTEEEDQ
jgi:hypothetical protein